ncbi:MAG TPA: glutamate--tRNA ligase family protein [Gemmatimonadales bacterium]|nr:glutamate--tRNA ligase family protein [Gemmatimonadales bacterium]
MIAGPTTRFAPAPTGYLHLGHLVNAIHVWGLARARQGRVILRVEDHDRGRSRPEYEAALLEDLDWLGLTPDFGLPAEFRGGPTQFRQSDSGARYEAAAESLRAAGHLLYGCDCSRRDLAREGGDEPDRETRYTGRCRSRGLQPGPGVGLRLAIEPGRERFMDLLLGPQQQDPSVQCGDLLLRDRLGNWTYQFAVVVDDMAQGVNLVVRGADLLESTGRQLLLARLLGRREPPLFAHHGLIRHPGGGKLSKANRDTALRELRAAGATPEELLGRAAAMAGLIPQAAPLSVDQLPSLIVAELPFEARPILG